MSAAAVSLHCGPEMCGSCREWIDSQLAAKDAEIEALRADAVVLERNADPGLRAALDASRT